MQNSNKSVSRIFNLANRLRINKENEVDYVGRILLLNGKPELICTNELAASFLSHSLQAIRNSNNMEQLMKASLLVIKIDREQHLI